MKSNINNTINARKTQLSNAPAPTQGTKSLGEVITLRSLSQSLRWMALVLVLLGGSQYVKAQSGTSQSQAFNMPIFQDNPSTGDFNCTSSNIWFKFIPTDDKVLIMFTTNNSATNYNFNLCEVYENNTLIAGGTILATQITLL